MKKYNYKATNLIAEAFKNHDVKFSVASHHVSEQILAGFHVDCGPNVVVRFISCDNGNDVAVRIFNLISNVPDEKKARVIEACNILNDKIRYMKFCIDSDGDINIEYDFPVHSPDDGIGEMAFEIFIRMMQILDSEYNIFMKALYSDEELDQKHINPDELTKKLELFRKMMETQESSEDNEDIEIDEEDKTDN